MEIIIQPAEGNSLGEFLKKCLRGEAGEFEQFKVSVAFAKKSGFKHLQTELSEFLKKGGRAKFVVGVDHEGTTYEGLEEILNCVGDSGEIWINHGEETHITFHPKIYLFEGIKSAVLIIGSNNITEGGLYTNDEAASVSWLSLENEDDIKLLSSVQHAFDSWSKVGSSNCLKLDKNVLESLLKRGYVINEAFIVKARENYEPAIGGDEPKVEESPLFGKSEIKRIAPKYKKTVGLKPAKPRVKEKAAAELAKEEVGVKGFVMTLQKTDVGVGQTTKGTSRRSPEIFIPLAARDYFPEFWGWKDEFKEDSTMPGKFDRIGVRMRIGAEVIQVNIEYSGSL